jgi:signal transduction histidine kinase
MFKRVDHGRLLRYSGLFTWAAVFVPLMYSQRSWQAWLAYAAFGAAYSWLTRELGTHSRRPVDFVLLFVMIFAAIAVSYYSETGLGSILLMLAACVLPWILSVRIGIVCLILSQLVVVPVFYEGLGLTLFESVMQSLLYVGFAGFVYVISLVGRQQAQAWDEQRRLNSELRATRALLAESVRVNERTRISRELHDLLGHHLTALSLNLEVANHLAEGKAQEHVSQARMLAKLLLSDVREAVSQIRDNDAIDMAATLMPLADNVPGLHIEMHLPVPFLIDDPERAHVLLRCTQEIVTNVVRHAEATTLDLHYRLRGDGIQLKARDDGRGTETPVAGNGLRGMRERLAAYGGDVEIETRVGGGFCLTLSLPLIQAPDRMGLPLGLSRAPINEPPVTGVAA